MMGSTGGKGTVWWWLPASACFGGASCRVLLPCCGREYGCEKGDVGVDSAAAPKLHRSHSSLRSQRASEQGRCCGRQPALGRVAPASQWQGDSRLIQRVCGIYIPESAPAVRTCDIVVCRCIVSVLALTNTSPKMATFYSAWIATATHAWAHVRLRQPLEANPHGKATRETLLPVSRWRRMTYRYLSS